MIRFSLVERRRRFDHCRHFRALLLALFAQRVQMTLQHLLLLLVEKVERLLVLTRSWVPRASLERIVIVENALHKLRKRNHIRVELDAETFGGVFDFGICWIWFASAHWKSHTIPLSCEHENRQVAFAHASPAAVANQGVLDALQTVVHGLRAPKSPKRKYGDFATRFLRLMLRAEIELCELIVIVLAARTRLTGTSGHSGAPLASLSAFELPPNNDIIGLRSIFRFASRKKRVRSECGACTCNINTP